MALHYSASHFVGLLLGVALAIGSQGCAVFTTAKGFVDTNKATRDAARDSADQTKQQVRDEKAKLKKLGPAVLGGAGDKNVKQDQPVLDPEKNSGHEGTRGGAKPMEVNRAETDSVSWPRQVRTRWKRVEIMRFSEQNILDCELHIDTTDTDLNLDIYDSRGAQIGFSPGPSPYKLKKLAVTISQLGTYFARIQAAQPKDESDFSVICNWEEAPEPVAQNTEGTATPPAPSHEHSEETPPNRHEPREPKEPKEIREPRKPRGNESIEERLQRGIEGRILQNSRDHGKMVLYLDKGSSAGIKKGTEGQILEGKSGLTPLDGGQFEVTDVVDDSKCVATSGAHSVGRNTRVIFFVK